VRSAGSGDPKSPEHAVHPIHCAKTIRTVHECEYGANFCSNRVYPRKSAMPQHGIP